MTNLQVRELKMNLDIGYDSVEIHPLKNGGYGISITEDASYDEELISNNMGYEIIPIGQNKILIR